MGWKKETQRLASGLSTVWRFPAQSMLCKECLQSSLSSCSPTTLLSSGAAMWTAPETWPNLSLLNELHATENLVIILLIQKTIIVNCFQTFPNNKYSKYLK